MKKTFTLLSSLLITAISFAYVPQTKLSINSLSNDAFLVTIDGNSYNLERNRNYDLIINDLSAGRHELKIYKKSERGRFKNQYSRPLYSTVIYLKERYLTDLIINRFGKVFIDEEPFNYNDNYPGNDYPYNNYPSGNPGYNSVMSSSNFEMLKTTLLNESFENNRINMIKTVSVNNRFSSTQVKQILSLFDFENNKLEVAKQLYSRTADKANYFVVYDAFNFPNSRSELATYIQQNP